MTLIIIGGGLAGASVAQDLRADGYQGPIDLFAAEDHLPYERPPLSKGVLIGKDNPDVATVKPQEWYQENNVTLHLGTRVSSLDPAAKSLLADGETYTYDKLVLATGSQPKHLPLADNSGKPVFYLRTVDDSEKLKAALEKHPKVAVIGGGWIGLEAAAAAREHGCDVTLYVRSAEPLENVLGPKIGKIFAQLHEQHGVHVELNTEPSEADLAKADLIIVGVGASPDVELAQKAGLAVDNGVLVNEYLQTSNPDIYAIGDIANELHPKLGRIRVEHWDNAIGQAKVAAANMLGGHEVYSANPYFFSDQYDLGMEYHGHVGPEGYDRVDVDGDPHGAFKAYWVKNNKVIAAMQANDWDASDEIKNAIGTTRTD